jgi:hypothetical protein
MADPCSVAGAEQGCRAETEKEGIREVENPATWGDTENVIHNAIIQDHYAKQEGRAGFSLARKIADALREAGLLKDAP